jgi:hypothetical protein
MPEKSLSVLACTGSINKAVRCPGSVDVDYIREAVNSLDGHIRSYPMIRGARIAHLV